MGPDIGTVQSLAKNWDFFSSIFLRIKNDGNYRMILNLKKINKYIECEHFKMESSQNVLHTVKPKAWKASVNLKDAYHFVPIHEE